MQIRGATHSDITEIVSLLKASLGESLMPKSEAYWRWKHIENPFGESPVLVACMDGKIVGVRAFMRWSWESRDEKFEAVRAVDTATHPEYQGKGIFKKLTLALLKECQLNGFNLVYNTPNTSSLPGYLKMGWVKVGKYPLRVHIARPIKIFQNLFMNNPVSIDSETDDSVVYFLNHPWMPKLLLLNRQFQNNRIITAHNLETLNWRYNRNPVAQYHALGIERNKDLDAVLIYRLKCSKIGKELRITDFFLKRENAIKSVRGLLDERVRTQGVDFVTFAGTSGPSPLKGLLSLKHTLGPMVTMRDIQDDKLNEFRSFGKWCPTLGDLELF